MSAPKWDRLILARNGALEYKHCPYGSLIKYLFVIT